MLTAWWLGATMAGVVTLVVVANVFLARSRAQSCADAVALALVTHTRTSVDPLLDALNVRILSMVHDGTVVTVEVDTPWGPSRATATTGT